MSLRIGRFWRYADDRALTVGNRKQYAFLKETAKRFVEQTAAPIKWCLLQSCGERSGTFDRIPGLTSIPRNSFLFLFLVEKIGFFKFQQKRASPEIAEVVGFYRYWYLTGQWPTHRRGDNEIKLMKNLLDHKAQTVFYRGPCIRDLSACAGIWSSGCQTLFSEWNS